MGVVAADYTYFSARYPELVAAGVTSPLYSAYFSEAGLYCDNTDASPVVDFSVGGQRYLFLNMLAAHIAAMNGPSASPLVGRVASASEGSVTVATEYASVIPGSMAWYVQTKYGAAFWTASAQYRRFTYSAPCPPVISPSVGGW